MSSLVANGGPAPATSPVAEPPVTNNGFWPDIDVAALRAASRLTGNVTPDRLRTAVTDAVMDANRRLADYKARMVAQGWDSAADIGETIGGKSEIVTLYQRAVANLVQAAFADGYRDWDTTRAGDYRADFEGVAADDFRRNAAWAISDIQGLGRTTVELL
jgi:Phage head completion protein (GPL).